MAAGDALSPDNDFLLDINQEELVKRLDVENILLLDILQSRNVLTLADAQVIHSLHTKRLKCEKVLDIVRSLTNRDFQEFCAALHECGRGHLVHNFLSPAALEKRIKQLQHHLAAYYRDTYMDDMFAYHDEGHHVPLEGLYQPLQWLTHDTSRRTVTKPLDSYLDLFKQKNGTGRFVITAEANGGKTTMLRKICRDWADLHLDGATGTESVLSKFDIVLPIILRAVKEGSTVIETIQDQLGLSDKDVRTMRFFLQSKSVNLIIIDGLDEYNVSKSPEVTAVMSGDLHESSWCIITSRPEGTTCLKDWPRVHYQQAELKGFSEASIRKYVQQFFPTTDVALGERLLHTLFPPVAPDAEWWAKDGSIEDPATGLLELACNSGRLSLICIIYSENETLPTVKEQLTEEFIMFMLRRWEKKCRIPVSPGKHVRRDVMDRNKDVLLKMSSLAAKTDGSSMKLVFEYDEVKPLMDGNLMQVGLLYKSHPVSRLEDCEYSFLHKSIQEYLAAYHIYSCKGDGAICVKTVFDKMITILVDNADDDDNRLICMLQLWVMCGFVSLQQLSLLLVDALHQLHDAGDVAALPIILLGGLRHAPLAQMVLPEPVTVERGDDRITFLLPMYVVQQVRGGPQLAPPTVSIRPHNGRESVVFTWPVHIGAFRVIDVMCEAEDNSKIRETTDSATGAVITYFHHMPMILEKTTVDILTLQSAGNKDLGYLSKGIKSIEITDSKLTGKAPWLAHTLACLDPQEISIQTCGLQQQDLQDMTRYLQQHHSSLAAETLYFRKNDLSGAGEDIVKLLQHMPQLKKLDLANSHLSRCEIHQMTSYLQQHQNSLAVETICFRKNDLTGAGQDIVMMLEHMPQLRKINLGNSHLTEEDKEAVLSYFNRRQASVELCMDDVDSSTDEDDDSSIDEQD